jgi:hypothetical protein
MSSTAALDDLLMIANQALVVTQAFPESSSAEMTNQIQHIIQRLACGDDSKNWDLETLAEGMVMVRDLEEQLPHLQLDQIARLYTMLILHAIEP